MGTKVSDQSYVGIGRHPKSGCRSTKKNNGVAATRSPSRSPSKTWDAFRTLSFFDHDVKVSQDHICPPIMKCIKIFIVMVWTLLATCYSICNQHWHCGKTPFQPHQTHNSSQELWQRTAKEVYQPSTTSDDPIAKRKEFVHYTVSRETLSIKLSYSSEAFWVLAFDLLDLGPAMASKCLIRKYSESFELWHRIMDHV